MGLNIRGRHPVAVSSEDCPQIRQLRQCHLQFGLFRLRMGPKNLQHNAVAIVDWQLKGLPECVHLRGEERVGTDEDAGNAQARSPCLHHLLEHGEIAAPKDEFAPHVIDREYGGVDHFPAERFHQGFVFGDLQGGGRYHVLLVSKFHAGLQQPLHLIAEIYNCHPLNPISDEKLHKQRNNK